MGWHDTTDSGLAALLARWRSLRCSLALHLLLTVDSGLAALLARWRSLRCSLALHLRSVVIGLLVVLSVAILVVWLTINSGTITVGVNPAGVAFSPDGRRAYITNRQSDTVSVIDTGATIPVGRAPTGVAVSPDGRRAYITNSNSDSVSVIDTDRGAVTTTISVGRGPLEWRQSRTGAVPTSSPSTPFQ